MADRVKVLVVDDSLTMRGLISAALKSDPEIEVVGTAADPLEARTAIKELNPDVLTLDVEMPNMNGLEFLDKIMRLRPMPVVMVSTLTAAGTDVTLAALEIGAVDAVAKPAVASAEAFHELIGKVKTAARSRVRARGDVPAAAAAPSAYRPAPNHVLAIGSSTGGVEALLTVLSGFPANCPATVITQHMPATFTSSFAARLDRVCAPAVSEAVDGAPLKPGHIYLAPGGAAHLELTPGLSPRCRLVNSEPVNGHRPSVDVMFDSVVRLKRPMTGVILTGMGKDGAKGLKAIRDAGGRTLGQDETTSVVYGMPKAAFELGAVERQLPLHRLAPAILDLCADPAARSVA
ncbi:MULTISPECIES: protein-glutamate methylesterase/protein-glutamine glutaminase [Brevundimonas]|jgi:two-component system chemotaxis response regulator CheB|uniref:Protein-glutamate methylesterase/protein-glutamine glutaminase n=1 Tax=Brevundimonas aurantiaca TaxID=74316 RepID=A0A7W9C8R2_9CAUL|nr:MULTISPECIES: chemotaxis response regulator protein-glutamate methylesterase [Brevundimonas]MBB1180430.1 chemotaxis response regulator protein-glutamate methylesterase [Pseudomonas sp. FW305-3-2-15-E-TSA4]MEC7796879.1 chemotaxis response regulator protein-glutamate methylesterase [Pseudomonadota bacterium]MBA4787744.1 chemotaxis response regulator protein-glutamate methylesterase [Brevundimonas sp.]MBB5741064.1 two-component system chemotaxis response regulator CheB [Brevundimonas aurantiaca